MGRPGIKLDGKIPVYAFAVSEGAAWGVGGGLVLTDGFTPVALGGAILGGSIGLVAARWYLPRVREED